MGALVVVVPTIDTVEEAQEAINWTYFPPIGRRSFGGGQGASELWSKVPGGYRETWNENVVLILMIETLEGVENAREIAKLPGATGTVRCERRPWGTFQVLLRVMPSMKPSLQKSKLPPRKLVSMRVLRSAGPIAQRTPVSKQAPRQPISAVVLKPKSAKPKNSLRTPAPA